MTIVYRADKGSPLTSNEVDGNFHDLDDRVGAVEGDGAFGLDSITYTGATITFNWSDGTSDGPYALPLAMPSPAGEWMPATSYHALDLVSVATLGLFMVLQDHVSAATFDPAAADTSGPIYQQISGVADMTGRLHWRGDFAGTLEYLTDDVFLSPIYGLILVLQDHISAASFDPNEENSEGALYRQLAPPVFAPVEADTGTTRTLALTDAGKYLRFPNGCAVTFPPIAFPTDTEIHLRQTGANPVTFIEGAGVTLNAQRDGYDTATTFDGATVTAKCVGSLQWDLIGPPGAELT